MATGNTYKNHYLDAGLGTAHASTFPATVYLALFSAAPSDAGGGTELSGLNYSRVAITNDDTNWPDAVSGVKSNALTITFAAPSSNWPTVTHFALFDASTAGDIVHWGPLTSSVTAVTGASVIFDPGTIVVQVA